MKSIEKANIKEGTRVLVRVDWNLPVNETGEILDASRIVNLDAVDVSWSEMLKPKLAVA